MLARSLRRLPALGTFKPSNLVAGVKSKVVHPVKYCDMDAQMYSDVMHKKANKFKNGRIRIGTMKILIAKCEKENKPEGVKLVFDAIEMIQGKNFDFTSEISSRFVRYALNNGAGKEAAELLTRKDHRLSAWVSLKPYTALTEYLANNGEVELLINLTKNLIGKGAHVPPEFASELLLKTASEKGDASLYEQAVAVVGKIIPSPDLEKLKETHKVPVAAAAAAEAQ